MSCIKLSEIEIKSIDGGLYCLNDLHEASGGERSQSPTEWFRSDKVNELVSAVEKKTNARAVKKVQGRNGGTFVCEILVYSYAMWISPQFHMHVIDVFRERAQATSTISGVSSALKMKSDELRQMMDKTEIDIKELKSHGYSWSAYGLEIKRAKKQAADELNALKDEVQLKLDLIFS